MARTATHESTASESNSPAIGLVSLTEDAIAKRTDINSFKRGRGYARSGRIYRAVLRENTLRARCHGSSGGPYHVEATLAKAGQSKKQNPVAFSCDCPRGGFCKHVVALLLTWIDRPESFEIRPPVAETLASKSPEELYAIIELMMSENPDLEDLVYLAIPSTIPSSDAPVDETTVRRQIAAAMQDNNGYGRGGWDRDGGYAATRIASSLERLIELANTYANAGDWRNVVSVSATFVEEFAPHYHPFYDQNGDLASLLSLADDALADSLEAQDEVPEEDRLLADERKRLLEAILIVWETDIKTGGLDVSNRGPEAIACCATPEEQQHIAGWLRQWMQSASNDEPKWHKQAAIRLLSTLAGDAGLSNDELLAEYRNAELWEQAATLLLGLGRIDEAVSLAARHLSPFLLIPFADRLIASGDPPRIERATSLIDDRLWEREGENVREDQALREWLERQYSTHGKPEMALEFARRRFKSTPNKSAYDAVKSIALRLDQTDHPWPPLRKELIAALQKASEWYALIDVYLEEGEVAEALKALGRGEKSKRASWSYGWSVSPGDFAARVAAAAESDFPDESIRIYRDLAEKLIGARNRASYGHAAGYLVRVWRLLDSHGRGEEWPGIIGDLRTRYRTFKALQEELDILGLR